jgi:CheY-like chemotaxis protein
MGSNMVVDPRPALHRSMKPMDFAYIARSRLRAPTTHARLRAALFQLVELAVPRADADEEGNTASPNWSATGERDAAGNLTDASPLVLVVDDQPLNQLVAVRQLAKLGYCSQIVSNGREALEAIRCADYAAVLMDCQMPEMDGYDATREIRRREHASAHLPIVALTFAAGMDGFVSKPIHSAELRDTLATAIASSTDSHYRRRGT